MASTTAVAVPVGMTSIFNFVATTIGSLWPVIVIIFGSMLVIAFFESISDNAQN